MNPLCPIHLRVEYKENPLGIDVAEPRLSWLLDSSERGQQQTAYRVLAASSKQNLDADAADLWDSGKVPSSECIHVVYRGKPLESRQECWWKVQVWGKDGQPGAFSETAYWSMGLLESSDWKASWIGYDEPLISELKEPDFLSLDGCKWCIYGDAPMTPEVAEVVTGFRGQFVSEPGKHIQRAQIVLTSGGQFKFYLNGEQAASSNGHYFAWQHPVRTDITDKLKEGMNTLVVEDVYAHGMAPGMIGCLFIDYAGGVSKQYPFDKSWKAMLSPTGNWTQPGFDDTAWNFCTEAAVAGEAPWGAVAAAPEDIPNCPCLRKTFEVKRPVRRAVAYASAMGLYELHINGRKVGDDLFRPGWTDYTKRMPYQAYDVTDYLHQGKDAIGIIVGHGWYSGYLGWSTIQRGQFGHVPRAMVQLEIQYDDGGADLVMTDVSWKAAHGPIIGSDMLMGEQYDARRELDGWDSPDYDDQAWRPVSLSEPPAVPLCAYPGVPIRVFKEISPASMTQPEPGAFLFDMKQNMVGWVRLRVQGPAGTKVTLRFAEMLNPDGTLYVENIRSARATDEYWLSGKGEEIWEPRFTFHGFRFVEMRGFPGEPGLDAITGIVATSDTPPAGSFECSNPMLNQLQSNIQWGLRGNFFEVPTDCPQRDERQGWTGDAQVFAPTACFNVNTGAFFTKWMQDVVDGQTAEGAFPDIAPHVLTLGIKPGSPGYADVGVTVPWAVYQSLGDTRMLETHYEAMRKWVDYLSISNPNHLWLNNRACDHGDWLSLGVVTPKEVVATAYFAQTTRLFARIAAILGKQSDADKYGKLADAIRSAFINAYVQADGHIHGDTQGSYILALRFGLVPDELRSAAAALLVERLQQEGMHLVAGFMGCPCSLFALEETGHLEAAYQLLQNDTFPSWGYSIKHGATTIWERWNGWTHADGFQDPAMNSFNHYAFGSVGEWMYRVVAGLNPDPDAPGYKHAIIHPRPGGGLDHARAEYDSMYGRVASHWKITGGNFELCVRIPANTSASVFLPTATLEQITESGKPVASAEYVQFVSCQNGLTELAVSSGEYHFLCPWK